METLTQDTFVTLPDVDAGPTKAWIVSHRRDSDYRIYYEHAYGKRPHEELSDVTKDPDQMNNLANHPAYASVTAKLRMRLMDELHRTGDPRVVDGGSFFENPPMAVPIPP